MLVVHPLYASMFFQNKFCHSPGSKYSRLFSRIFMFFLPNLFTSTSCCTTCNTPTPAQELHSSRTTKTRPGQSSKQVLDKPKQGRKQHTGKYHTNACILFALVQCLYVSNYCPRRNFPTQLHYTAHVTMGSQAIWFVGDPGHHPLRWLFLAMFSNTQTLF